MATPGEFSDCRMSGSRRFVTSPVLTNALPSDVHLFCEYVHKFSDSYVVQPMDSECKPTMCGDEHMVRLLDDECKSTFYTPQTDNEFQTSDRKSSDQLKTPTRRDKITQLGRTILKFSHSATYSSLYCTRQKCKMTARVFESFDDADEYFLNGGSLLPLYFRVYDQWLCEQVCVTCGTRVYHVVCDSQIVKPQLNMWSTGDTLKKVNQFVTTVNESLPEVAHTSTQVKNDVTETLGALRSTARDSQHELRQVRKTIDKCAETSTTVLSEAADRIAYSAERCAESVVEAKAEISGQANTLANVLSKIFEVSQWVGLTVCAGLLLGSIWYQWPLGIAINSLLTMLLTTSVMYRSSPRLAEIVRKIVNFLPARTNRSTEHEPVDIATVPAVSEDQEEEISTDLSAEVNRHSGLNPIWLLVSLLGCVAVGPFVGSESVTGVIQSLRSCVLFTTVASSFEGFFDKLLSTLPDMCQEWLKNVSGGRFTTHSKEAEYLMDEMHSIATMYTPAEIAHDIEGQTRVTKWQRRFRTNAPSLFKHCPHLRSLLVRSAKSCDEYLAVLKGQGEMGRRECPFSVSFCGPVGIGKSTMMPVFLFKMMLPGDRYPNSKLMYSRNASTNFFDGYTGQFALLYDEFADTNKYEDVQEFMTMVSCAEMVLPMASLDDISVGKKGTKFSSKIVISCSNQFYPTFEGQRTPSALWRRRHVLVRTKVIPAHATVDGRLQPNTFAQYTAEQQKTFPWLRFDILESIPTDANHDPDDNVIRQSLTFNEMIEFCKNRRIAHVTQEEDTTRIINEYLDDVLEDPQLLQDAEALANQQVDEDAEDQFGAQVRQLNENVDGQLQRNASKMPSSFGSSSDSFTEDYASCASTVVDSATKASKTKSKTGKRERQRIAKQKKKTDEVGMTLKTTSAVEEFLQGEDKSGVYQQRLAKLAASREAPSLYPSDNCMAMVDKIRKAKELEGKSPFSRWVTEIWQKTQTYVSIKTTLLTVSGILAGSALILSVYKWFSKSTDMVSDVDPHFSSRGSNVSHAGRSVGRYSQASRGSGYSGGQSVMLHSGKEGGLEKTAKNVALLKTDKHVTNCTFVAGRIFVTAKHFFTNGRMENGDSFTIVHNGVEMKDTFDWSRVYMPNDEDVAYVLCSNTVRPFPDITKHFVKNSELKYLNNFRSNFVTLDRADSRMMVQATGHGSLDARRFNYTIEDHVDEKNAKRVFVAQSFKVSGRTKQGDCGGLLRNANPPGVGGHCLGIHFCELVSEKGFGRYGIVTQEDIEKAQLELLKEPAIRNCFVVDGGLPEELIVDAEPKIVFPPGKDNFSYQGRLPKKMIPGSSRKSAFVESEVFAANEYAIPVDSAPSALSADDPRVEDKAPSPIVKAVSKYGKEQIEFPSNMKLASKAYRMKVLRQPCYSFAGVLTWDEAVQSTPYFDHFGALDMTTSEGWPFQLNRPVGKRGKAYLFDVNAEGNYVLSEQLRGQCTFREQQAELGFRVPSLWVDTLKDEKRELEKIRLGKTRSFTSAPVDFTLLCRKYTGAFVNFYMDAGLTLGNAGGLNPESLQWTEMMDHLREVGEAMIAGDYSGWDGHIPPLLFEEVRDIINAWYQQNDQDWRPEDDRVRAVLFDEMCFTYTITGGDVRQKVCGNPSGNALTMVFNTMVNNIYARWIYLELAPQELARTELFDDNCRFVALGDDHIMSLSPEVMCEITMPRVQLLMAVHGIGYTPPDKSSETPPDHYHYGDVEFLKRTTELRGGVYWAKLDQQSLRACLNWIKNCSDLDGATANNIEVVAKYYFMYGPRHYNEYCQTMMKLWSQRGCQTPLYFSPYQELFDMFMSDRLSSVYLNAGQIKLHAASTGDGGIDITTEDVPVHGNYHNLHTSRVGKDQTVQDKDWRVADLTERWALLALSLIHI